MVLLLNGYDLLASFIFALVDWTDWIDGQLARRTNCVSKLGQLLDPAVDRILMSCGVIGLMLYNMVAGIMGEKGRGFRNWICAVAMFILFCNVSGLFGLRPPTADYGVTLPLGLITFALIQINGLRAKKIHHITSLFQPSPILFPINLIGEIAVPLSLSLRLFGNIMSGTILMGLLYGLLPAALKVGIPAVIHVYCDIFSGAIQTYVFCMLTMVYINDKISD